MRMYSGTPLFGHESQTLIYREPRFTDTGYVRTVDFIVTIMC